VPLAAKENDLVTATDTHLIQPPGTAPTVPTPGHTFKGLIDGSLSDDVKIEKRKAATVGSTATNTPPHIPIGGTFVNPPSNRGSIETGSSSVSINGEAAARAGDTAKTCNDPTDLPIGTVEVAAGTVSIGG
jgi:uncharacterized Zn-binding protein involved in type VI secretion